MRPRDRSASWSQADADDSLPRRHRPDYGLLVLSAILLTIGLIVIYAISPGLSIAKHVSQNYYINKQLIAVGMGIVAFIIAANLPLTMWRRLQKPLIFIALMAALAVRLVGQPVNGAYRWIQIGGISFQSSELIKIALLIWLAGFLADKIRSKQISDTKQTLKPLIIIVAAVAFIVVGIQNDLGSAAVIISMMAIMVYVAGLPMKKVITIGSLLLAVAVLAVLVTPYRRDRVLTLFKPTSNCQTTGYQSCQALIAVGSGGLMGLGLGRSIQAYGYLPEPANDSIFAIYGEKFGFIGSIVLLGLFMALFTKLKTIMERAPNEFTRLIVVGTLAWLSTQTLINVGAMIGLLPFEGITLPFISSGGTSVLFVMTAIGLVFQISHYTSHRIPAVTQTKGKRYDNSVDRRRLGRSYNPPVGGRARA